MTDRQTDTYIHTHTLQQGFGPGVMAHVYKPSTKETETGGLLTV